MVDVLFYLKQKINYEVFEVRILKVLIFLRNRLVGYEYNTCF